MNPTILGAMLTGLVVILVNAAVTLRSSGRIEGSVAATLTAMSERQDNHESETTRRFEHVGRELMRQRDEITDQGKDVAWCKAKLTNGSAGKAHA